MIKGEKEDLVNVVSDEGGVCISRGFAASGIVAGIKVSGDPDIASIVNQGPEKAAAAILTINRVQATPVTVSKKHIVNGKPSAMMLNSGNANAYNGQPSIVDVPEVCQKVIDRLGVDITKIGTCSTGLISDRLSMDIMLADVPKLCENLGSDATAGTAAAEAILTADLVAKQAVAHGDGFTVGAVGKGVGMTSPSMATMLDVITTGASVSAEMVHEVTTKTSEVMFNRLDIDGPTSTNDIAIILANGVSGVKPSQEKLDQVVLSVCDSIVRQMQSDVEGATKRMSATVRDTGGVKNTLVTVRIIGRDNLLKCAVFDSGPDWGRVLTAVGAAPVDVGPEHVTVPFNGCMTYRDTGGMPDVHEVDLSGKDTAVKADLDTGNPGETTIHMTDLSHDYVHISSAYSS